jgi:hypothetical protein
VDNVLSSRGYVVVVSRRGASQHDVEARLCRSEPMVGASGFRPLNVTNDHEDSIGVACMSSYNPLVTRFRLIRQFGTSAAFHASARRVLETIVLVYPFKAEALLKAEISHLKAGEEVVS